MVISNEQGYVLRWDDDNRVAVLTAAHYNGGQMELTRYA